VIDRHAQIAAENQVVVKLLGSVQCPLVEPMLGTLISVADSRAQARSGLRRKPPHGSPQLLMRLFRKRTSPADNLKGQRMRLPPNLHRIKSFEPSGDIRDRLRGESLDRRSDAPGCSGKHSPDAVPLSGGWVRGPAAVPALRGPTAAADNARTKVVRRPPPRRWVPRADSSRCAGGTHGRPSGTRDRT
jgi:hypothetical protein